MSSKRAGSREWTGLAVLALPTLLLSLDQSVLFLALPPWPRRCGPAARRPCGSWTSTGS
ncbi:hypothetical protein [Nonomuraea recticatena]|uniref:hypothetical protein n=1 Tax=Nonomuraea recticatena TaxID=46178 RepID=UPI003612B867